MTRDHPLEVNLAVPGGRVEMYAIRDENYPGGWFYRFQYYHPDGGEILRYDDAHEDALLGWHHRHVRCGLDEGIDFYGLPVHVSRFLTDISSLPHSEYAINDTN